MLIGSFIGCKLTPVELLFDKLYLRNKNEFCTGLSVVPRAVATVGRIVSTIFSAMRRLHPPFWCLLGRWFRIWHRKFRFRRKINRTGHSKFLQLQWGTKHSKFDNFNKKRWYRLEMTRRFHILSQNLNRIAVDPFWPKNGRKRDFASFRPFSG